MIALLLWWVALVPGFHGPQITPAELRAEVERYDWNADEMTATFWCESLGFTKAVSPTGDATVAQFNVPTWAGLVDIRRAWRDWRYAIRAAYEVVYEEQGPSAWSCWRLLFGDRGT